MAGLAHRTQWLNDPMFQPMREYLERVCVLRDWGEVVVATNLVLEPLLQRVLYRTLSDLGNAHPTACCRTSPIRCTATRNGTGRGRRRWRRC